MVHINVATLKEEEMTQEVRGDERKQTSSPNP
jgi:hypothetical protein